MAVTKDEAVGLLFFLKICLLASSLKLISPYFGVFDQFYIFFPSMYFTSNGCCHPNDLINKLRSLGKNLVKVNK